MATGKSTIGARIAAGVGVPFLDTDALLAQRSGKSIGELFASDGEARFREREAELVLPMLSDLSPRVIALGGGTVTMPRVRHALLERCTLVTLTAAPETVVARVSSLRKRPNLWALSPLDRARDLLSVRHSAYAESHALVATEGQTPKQIAERVIDVAGLDTLVMPLGTRSYVVELANDEPSRLAAALAELNPSSLLVVTDQNVVAARAQWLDAALEGVGVARHTVVIKAGEVSKTLATVARIWDEALLHGLDRDAVVLAFGGGVVGDLAGFAASTLLRGIRCVQVPTSLLAMVDSSVGGKTGFDHAAGKNLIGSFFQPNRVVVDVEHLSTLPKRERAAGLAEVVKIALVRSVDVLEQLEAAAEAIACGDRAALRSVVRSAIALKINLVRDDERENGSRALLNLGHTVGHALESQGEYTRLLHGEAVAIGTCVELAATERMGLSAPGLAARARLLFERLGLPTKASPDELGSAWPFVLSDKKRSVAGLKLPVVTTAGHGAVVRVTVEHLRRAVLLS